MFIRISQCLFLVVRCLIFVEAMTSFLYKAMSSRFAVFAPQLRQLIFVDDGTGAQQGLSACLLEITWILLACYFYATTVLASNAIVLVDIYWLFFREPTLQK